MDDTARRTAPIPAEPIVFSGVTIALAAPMARFSLRARDPEQLGQLIGRAVPTRIGASENGVCCLGPDEWLLRLPSGTTVPWGEGLPLSITDISERALCITVEGSGALEVLSSGCPRNIARFPEGYATRTIYEGVEIILLREGADRFAVEVWQSFASWLWAALTKAAAHLTRDEMRTGSGAKCSPPTDSGVRSETIDDPSPARLPASTGDALPLSSER